FRILVTAESSAAVGARSGRIVVRGTSPAARTLAHRDLSTAFTPGVLGGAMAASMPHVHDAFVPGQGVDVRRLPAAQPSRTIVLHDRDTLTLTASLVRRSVAGRDIAQYAYDGQVPGPTLRARQGATVVVRFRNRIDQPSTVHWHGVRLAD